MNDLDLMKQILNFSKSFNKFIFECFYGLLEKTASLFFSLSLRHVSTLSIREFKSELWCYAYEQ